MSEMPEGYQETRGTIMNTEESTPRTCQVGFICLGDSLHARQNCLFYKDDGGEHNDCKGLQTPNKGDRIGLCWDADACAYKSYTWLKFCDEIAEKVKEEQNESV